MKCPHCGRDLPKDVATCPECGEDVSAQRDRKNKLEMIGLCALLAVLLVILGFVVFGNWNKPKTNGTVPSGESTTAAAQSTAKTTRRAAGATRAQATAAWDETTAPLTTQSPDDPQETTAPSADQTTAAAPEPTTVSPDATVTLPSYEGMDYVDYYSALIAAGFDNISRENISSVEVPAGQVISVSSEKSAYTPEEAFDAPIVVYVSTGE